MHNCIAKVLQVAQVIIHSTSGQFEFYFCSIIRFLMEQFDNDFIAGLAIKSKCFHHFKLKVVSLWVNSVLDLTMNQGTCCKSSILFDKTV